MVGFKSKLLMWITFSLLILAVLSILLALFGQQTKLGCTKSDKINTSIEIYKGELTSIGFNLDKSSLTFGRVSPGAVISRDIYVTYSKEAVVEVWMESNFTFWINIKPQSFKIYPNEKKAVQFMVNVPLSAESGDYKGKVIICYRDE